MANNLIKVTFLKECRVDNKLYKAGDFAQIPVEIAATYSKLNKLVFGDRADVKAKETKAAAKKTASKKTTKK